MYFTFLQKMQSLLDHVWVGLSVLPLVSIPLPKWLLRTPGNTLVCFGWPAGTFVPGAFEPLHQFVDDTARRHVVPVAEAVAQGHRYWFLVSTTCNG